MERVIHLQAKLSEKQHEVLKAKAAKAGMGLAELVVAMIESRGVVEAKSDLKPALRELNGWFGRLNSNINMLSRHANVYKQDANSDLILMRLNELRDDVRLITHKANSLQPKRGRPRKND
ncbi:MAG: plasmid mobilization protein [Pseudomonas sp.]